MSELNTMSKLVESSSVLSLNVSLQEACRKMSEELILQRRCDGDDKNVITGLARLQLFLNAYIEKMKYSMSEVCEVQDLLIKFMIWGIKE